MVKGVLKQSAPRRRAAGRRNAVLACAALACASVLLLAGCKPAAAPGQAAAGPNAAATPVTITALIWAPDWPEEMQHIAAEFTRLNPDVKVDVQFMIGNSVEENLKPKVATRNLPDLMSVNPNPYAAELADQGVLADVGNTQAWQRVRPGLKADWISPNGKRFGISGGVAATLIYYNKEMFAKAGITQLPTDFGEFLAVCERLKHAGFTPIYWNGGFPNLIGNGAFSFGFANNIVPKTPDWKARLGDGTLALDTPAGADIFAKIRTVAQRGYTQPNFMQSGYDDGIRAFVEGKTAMAFEGTWAAGALLHPKSFEVGVFVPPWNDKGAATVPVIGSETGLRGGRDGQQAGGHALPRIHRRRRLRHPAEKAPEHRAVPARRGQRGRGRSPHRRLPGAGGGGARRRAARITRCCRRIPSTCCTCCCRTSCRTSSRPSRPRTACRPRSATKRARTTNRRHAVARRFPVPASAA